jgi:hypothetical protein
MWKQFVFSAIGLAALAGCASVTPIQQDQPLMLAAGDGIAVVQFNTVANISQVQIVSAQSGGENLNIPSVPLGKSTFLFQVPAGRYCLQRFWWDFWAKNILVYHPGQYVGCFVVPAGELGFSGIYSPRWENTMVIAGRNLDIAEAQAQLTQDYPHIAAQFLRPEPVAPEAPTPTAPPPAGSDQTSAWLTHKTNSLEEDLYVRNNTQWPIVITLFELYDCANIKPACTPTHPDFKLAPHQTRLFMAIAPGDPQGAYAFHYRFSYRFQ